MLATLARSVRDTSVLRRLLFAWWNLPKDLPDVWKLAIEFAIKNKDECVTDRTTLKLLLDSVEKLDGSAFENDQNL